MAAKTKRVPKSKEELKVQMAHLQRVEKQKQLARLVFPVVASMKTIYDAQTVVNALAGFVKAELADKLSTYRVIDLDITLSKEKDGPIKAAILALRDVIETETAEDAAALLEKFGNSLGQYSSSQYMKNSMKSIKMDEFIA